MHTQPMHEVLAEAIVGRHLLTHPFYRRWEAGTLAERELAAYAEQYRHIERELPVTLAAIADALPAGHARELVEANLADELGTPEPHVELFESFARATGAAPEARATPSTAALPPEPDLGEAAKIEARLVNLETAVKDRSNEAHARLDAEKAETHTLEKIAELGALVTRLTGQVKDLQDKVQTLWTGADEKFADLTRRVALGEANRAVASAENAGSAGLAAQAQAKGSADGSEAQEQTRTKVAAADVKHKYRIQAASPGLAMLTAVDGSPDDRPVEVAIGTALPGYGKVMSIEQHGQAWVVKADRGSIE